MNKENNTKKYQKIISEKSYIDKKYFYSKDKYTRKAIKMDHDKTEIRYSTINPTEKVIGKLILTKNKENTIEKIILFARKKHILKDLSLRKGGIVIDELPNISPSIFINNLFTEIVFTANNNSIDKIAHSILRTFQRNDKPPQELIDDCSDDFSCNVLCSKDLPQRLVLIHGYVRNLEKTYSFLTIPTEITQIIIQLTTTRHEGLFTINPNTNKQRSSIRRNPEEKNQDANNGQKPNEMQIISTSSQQSSISDRFTSNKSNLILGFTLFLTVAFILYRRHQTQGNDQQHTDTSSEQKTSATSYLSFKK